MKFSTQLVVSILGITILAQAVFGSIAYWIIDDSHNQENSELLQHIIQTISKNLITSEDDTIFQASINKAHQLFSTTDTFLLVESTDDRSFTSSNTNQNTSILTSELEKTLKQSNTLKASHGSLNVDSQHYHWITSPLPDSQYHITLFQPHLNNDQTDFRLGMRLLSTSIIIIWLAVWLALLLSSIMSRRLKEKNDAIEHQALHDELTGLPNRNLLFDRLDQAQLASHRNKTSFALLLMDLDNFKEVNDTLGHHFGDLILKKISKIIENTLRENDSMARLGGDEFAVLLPDTDQEGAIICATKILDNLKIPLSIQDIHIESSASIGIAFYPQDGKDTETLLQRADIAMYQAKQSRSRHVIYDSKQDTGNVRHLTLMNELRAAIENNQISSHYQPMVDQQNNCTVAVEALARWHHPVLGLVSPEEFIPIAERTGIIRKLTLSIIKQAVHDLKKWHDEGYDMMVAINISTHCLQDYAFPRKLNQLLHNAGISANSVELEITESALMQDLSRARKVLNQLDQTGFRISIDDFGTGFSSLSYLKELPVDTLKIDRSFVFDMANNEDDTAIVQTVIELAHNFNCSVIAEGVEDLRTLEQLKKLGSNIAQGHLFSKPLPFEEISQWLRESEWGPIAIVSEPEKMEG